MQCMSCIIGEQSNTIYNDVITFDWTVGDITLISPLDSTKDNSILLKFQCLQSNFAEGTKLSQNRRLTVLADADNGPFFLTFGSRKKENNVVYKMVDILAQREVYKQI